MIRFETRSYGADQSYFQLLEPGIAIFALADGVSGKFGAKEAGMYVCNALSALGLSPTELSAARFAFELNRMDREMFENPAVGETTAILGFLTPTVISGVSVGNCDLRNLTTDELVTVGQARKPYVGSGRCTPTPFSSPVSGGDLLLAHTDGVDYPGLEAGTEFVDEESRFDSMLDRLNNQKVIDDNGFVLFEVSTRED